MFAGTGLGLESAAALEEVEPHFGSFVGASPCGSQNRYDVKSASDSVMMDGLEVCVGVDKEVHSMSVFRGKLLRAQRSTDIFEHFGKQAQGAI